MARTWTLGGITLPNPQIYEPTPVINATYNQTLNNKIKKQIRGRKTLHKIGLNALTRTEYNAIVTLVEQNAVQNFTVTDGSLTISSRNVHVEIIDRKLPYKGSEFREDITLELQEVD